LRVGLISDTHGLLRPEAVAALAGSDHVIHAGDIGTPEILAALGRIAPVTAVRGNNDRGAWARAIPETAELALGGARIYVIHDVAGLAIDPGAAGVQAVIAGHSHRPMVTEKDGVLFVNPGSAGPRRFRLPVSVGALEIRGGRVAARLVTLAA
jgi:putative phosphoesterase